MVKININKHIEHTPNRQHPRNVDSTERPSCWPIPTGYTMRRSLFASLCTL